MNRLVCFLRDEDAATAVEYAVMLALILLGIIGAISTVGGSTGDMWRSNVSALQSVGMNP
jgi:pilus assembly protein Flp/PilA